MSEDKKEEKEKPHIVCEISYAPNQDWRTESEK
jgi:hypothetical protein